MIEDAIYYQITNDADVAAVLGTRLYPVVVPTGQALPNATYQLVSDMSGHAIDGPVNLREAVFQLSVWAGTYDAASSLAKLVRGAVDGAKGTIASMDVSQMVVEPVRDLPWVSDDNEQQTRYGKAIDVRVFYRE